MSEDVIAFQETKVARSELEREFALADGWCVHCLCKKCERPPGASSLTRTVATGRESYFSFCRTRTGYSGVATFCRCGVAEAVAAEEGFTGVSSSALTFPSNRKNCNEGRLRLGLPPGVSGKDAPGAPPDSAAGSLSSCYGDLPDRCSTQGASSRTCAVLACHRLGMQSTSCGPDASSALASPAPGFGTTAILSWLHSDRPCRPTVLTYVISVGRKCALIPKPCDDGRFSLAELEAFDSEGRCVVTDHGAFVLLNVYGPAITNADTADERFAFKLRFFEARGPARLHAVCYSKWPLSFLAGAAALWSAAL